MSFDKYCALQLYSVFGKEKGMEYAQSINLDWYIQISMIGDISSSIASLEASKIHQNNPHYFNEFRKALTNHRFSNWGDSPKYWMVEFGQWFETKEDSMDEAEKMANLIDSKLGEYGIIGFAESEYMWAYDHILRGEGWINWYYVSVEILKEEFSSKEDAQTFIENIVKTLDK